MKSSVPCLLSILNCLFTTALFAGSTGGSGPPARYPTLDISLDEFNSLREAKTCVVDEHTYEIEEGDEPGELILREMDGVPASEISDDHPAEWILRSTLEQ